MKAGFFLVIMTVMLCKICKSQTITLGVPKASILSGSYEIEQYVILNTPDKDAIIYYTTDGSTPTTESNKVGIKPVAFTDGAPPELAFEDKRKILDITTTTKLKVMAVYDGKVSEVVEYNYIIRAPKPFANIDPGIYRTLPQNIELNSSDPKAKIFYTIDGSEPDSKKSTEFQSPINLTASATVKAISVREGSPESFVSELKFTADPHLLVMTDKGATPEKILAQMSLKEKVYMMQGAYYPFANNNFNLLAAAGGTLGIERLNIPVTQIADGPSGISFWNGSSERRATAWPNPSLVASSWDKTLMHDLGGAYAQECLFYGVDVLLGPAINIHRNPLGGRNWEYYSEDPMLTGALASNFVNGAQSAGVGTDLKHFAANNSENNRKQGDEIVDERTLREIYLRAFQKVVKNEQPWTIMSSHNKVNGSDMSDNKFLLKDVLKGEWKFKGYVMSDWKGFHHTTSYNNGFDLNMPGGVAPAAMPAKGDPPTTRDIYNAAAKGLLIPGNIDDAVLRILNVVMKTATFKSFRTGIETGKFNTIYDYTMSVRKRTELTPPLGHSSRLLARKAAAESFVLLKNEGAALPLKKGLRIAISGNNAMKIAVNQRDYQKGIIYGGRAASPLIKEAEIVSPIEGLEKAGFKTITNLKGDSLIEGLNQDLANEVAKAADLGIVSIGRSGREGVDNTSIDLSDQEKALIISMSNAFHQQQKKLIVLINSGGPVETASWSGSADAILWVGLPGEEAGNAIASVLSGDISPSGKLTDTWPVKYNDLPNSATFPPKGLATIKYDEGIYVGYRYFDKKNITPAYEFGYGLSYTKFRYSNLKISASVFNKSVNTTFTITNTGSKAGKEIAELYLSAPTNKLDKPVSELKGFHKTRLLLPGESQNISIRINADDLASFNSGRYAWIADAGQYEIKIGASSRKIILRKTFALNNEIVVEHVSNSPSAKNK